MSIHDARDMDGEKVLDMEVGHHYRTSYTFWLNKDLKLNNDHPARGQEGRALRNYSSFFVVDKMPLPDESDHLMGKNIIAYKVMTSDYICWIFLADQDRVSMTENSEKIIVEITGNQKEMPGKAC